MEHEAKLCDLFNLVYNGNIEFSSVSSETERSHLKTDFCSVLRFLIENMRKNNEIKETIHLLETIFKTD